MRAFSISVINVISKEHKGEQFIVTIKECIGIENRLFVVPKFRIWNSAGNIWNWTSNQLGIVFGYEINCCGEK